MKRLIIKRNLLPWYNEIYNTLDLNAPGFPQTVLNKIKTFGNSAIETIDKKKTTFVRVKKILPVENDSAYGADFAFIADIRRYLYP